MAKGNMKSRPTYLASVFRGIYARIASRLDVDPSYVSRVAGGERQSEEIEAALNREARRIMKTLKFNYTRFGHHSANHSGASRDRIGRHRIKTTRIVKK
jgi:hypothetical protein